MPKADSFRASPVWKPKPIGESKNCREQTAQHSARYQPISHVRPMRSAMNQKNNVGANCTDEQTEWQHDHHWMNWMPKQINLSCHKTNLLLRFVPSTSVRCRISRFIAPVFLLKRNPTGTVLERLEMFRVLLIKFLMIIFRRPEFHRRRSEEHTSELQSHSDLVCRLLL